MAIRIETPPDGVLAVLEQGLADIFDETERSALFLKTVAQDVVSAAADAASAGYPHPVFNATLENLIGSEGLAGATQLGWRHLHSGSEDIHSPATLASEVHADADAGGHQFAGTNEGHFVDQTRELLQTASQMKEVQDGEFRPCLLRIPALMVAALWLKAESGPDADVIIPMAPTHSDLEPGKPYSAEQLHHALQKAAGETLEFHNQPHPTEPPPAEPTE